MELKTY